MSGGTQTEPIVRARGLCKVARDGARSVAILQDINLDIARAETVALVGPSGAGKSSLLHILGALDTAFVGEVVVAGKPLHAASDSALASFRCQSVGFIFQAYNLLSHLSVQDNVMLPSRFGASPLDPVRARALLCEVGLAKYGERRPSTLSGGERQRVAIARALYQKPGLVLCDEPTGNLDGATSAEIIALFARLREAGVALLIATHDEALAMSTDRKIHINGGRLT